MVVVVVRVHVASVRRPGQAIRRRQCAPFSRLLYVFPPLLRILCRNKFFLRRIKILEGHSEYLARCNDIDVPRWEQNGCATCPYFSSSIVRIGVTPFRIRYLPLFVLVSSFFSVLHDKYSSEQCFGKEYARYCVRSRIENGGRGAISRYSVNFRSCQLLHIVLSVSIFSLLLLCVRCSQATTQPSDGESTRRLWAKLHAEFLTRPLLAEMRSKRVFFVRKGRAAAPAFVRDENVTNFE